MEKKKKKKKRDREEIKWEDILFILSWIFVGPEKHRLLSESRCQVVYYWSLRRHSEEVLQSVVRVL